MSFLRKLERSVGEILATAGVAACLYLAPATVQAQERPREDCTLSCGAPAAPDPSVSASGGTREQVKKVESLYLTPNSPESQEELAKKLRGLEQKVRELASPNHQRTHPEYGLSIQALKIMVEEVKREYNSNLDATKGYLDSLTRSTEGLTDAQKGMAEQIDTIIARLGVYDQSRKEVEERLNDPVMQYMKTIFAQGLRELDRAKEYEISQCAKVLGAYAQLASLEGKIAADGESLAQERKRVAVQTEALQKDSKLDAHAKVRRAEALRQGLQEMEATIAAREENAGRLKSGISPLRESCEKAKDDYDNLAGELPLYVKGNIFGERRGSGNLAMKVGGRYGFSDSHRGSVQATISHRGKRVTVSIGAGYGRGTAVMEESALPRSENRENVGGKYSEESVTAGMITRRQFYLADAFLELAPADIRLGRRSRYTLTPHVSAAVELSRDAITTKRMRTIQLSAGNELVGSPHSVSESDTEYKTGAAFVPSVGVDLCGGGLWGRESLQAICARLAAGYNVDWERPSLTVGGSIKFH